MRTTTSWVIALVLVFSACLAFADDATLPRCLPNATAVDASKQLIQLVRFQWDSSEIDSYAAFILVHEVLGYPAVVHPDTYYSGWTLSNGQNGPLIFDLLANGSASVATEIWQEYFPAQMIQQQVYSLMRTDFYPLGVVGQVGWYYFVPDSMLADNPLLDRLMWKDFQSSHISSIFTSNLTSNNSFGILQNGNPSWGVYDEMIIKNLNLTLKMHYWMTETGLFGNLTAQYEAGIPFLTYAYRPHAFFSLGIPLHRLYLPDYSDACYALATTNGVYCDYPPDTLEKALDPKLKSKAPGAYSMLQQMRFSMTDLEDLQGLVAYENNSTFEAACSWVKNNNASWSVWTENAKIADLKSNSNNKLSSGVITAIVVVVVVISVALIVALIGVRRYTRNAAATVKKMEEDQKASYNIPISSLSFGKLIGRGNFGEVYVGEYRGTVVAVKKLMNQKMTKQALEQFTSEVSTMVSLRHPNILLFMGACTDVPNLCIVTEYMRFGNLYDFLRNDTNVGYKLAHNFAVSITKGMQYIHAAGMLHRDLKTPNILLDKKMNVKISDFGLTCLAQNENALDHVSLLWTAPEILRAGKFTEKSDVYSMGIILWELLSQGAAPYPGLNVNAIARAVLDNTRPVILPEWDSTFAKLITACWDSDPAKRPTFAKISEALAVMDFEELDDDSISAGGMTLTGTEYSVTSTTEKTSSFNMYMPPPNISANTTFVATCVQNSYSLWQQNPTLMATALALANKELGSVAAKFRGYKTASNGDMTVLVFGNPFNALSFCMKAQQSLLVAPWPKELSNVPDTEEEWSTDREGRQRHILFRGLRVGMGVHCGLPLSTNIDALQTIFHGPIVDKAVHIGGIAQGGQILISQSVVEAMSQKVSSQRISVVIEGGHTENMFAKLDPHYCESLNLQSSALGTLYQLVPSILRDRVLSGPTNTQLLASYDASRPTAGDEEQPVVILPNLRDKWIVNPTSISEKVRTGMNQVGDLYKATYKKEFKTTPVTVQHIVSVKILDGALLAMRAEAARLINLQSSYISSFHGICINPLSLVWERCANGDLGTVLANNAVTLSFTKRVQFLKDISRGILYLLEEFKGAIVFELRPANLWIDENWVVKISDYGFQHIKISNQTVTQSQVVAWTAPEVCAGKPEDESAVMYSFAIIMWQMLTRKVPWEGRHSMKIMDAIEKGERPVIASSYMIDGMSAQSLDAYVKLLRQAWHATPTERPTFKEMIQNLDSL